MPKLPTANDLGESPIPQSSGQIVSIRPGGEAEALQRSGQALESTGEIFRKAQDQIDILQAEDAANRYQRELDEQAVGKDGYTSLLSGAVVNRNVVADYSARIGGKRGEIVKSLGTDAARRAFARRADFLEVKFNKGLLDHIGDQARAFSADTTTGTVDLETANAIENWQDQGARAAAMVRMFTTVDRHAELAGWSPERIAATKNKIETGVHLGVVDHLLAVRMEPQASAYFEAHRGRIDPKAATHIERGLGVARDQQAREAEAERKRVAAEISSDVEIGVRRGQFGYREIEQAYQSGILTPEKRVTLTTHLDTERKKAAEKAAAERDAIGRVQLSVDGRGYLDFRSEKDRKAHDLYFSKVFLPSLGKAGLSDDEKTQAFVDFSAGTGIVPKPLKEQIRGALRAGTPEAKAGMADLLDRLKTANPQILNDFANEDIALANTIGTYVRSGVAPKDAVALAEKNLSVPGPEREARRVRYAAEKAPTKNLKWLNDQGSGFRWFEPNMPAKLPDALVGEFERLIHEEFTRSGELDSARKSAFDHLRSVWGVTRTGKQPAWMKYAPETLYKVPGDDDGSWIREQLTADVTKNALFGGKPELSLAADSYTAREDRPSWVVLNKRDGVLEPLLGSDGKPLRFRPDFGTSPAGERRRKQLEAERAAAAQRPIGEPAPVTGRADTGRRGPANSGVSLSNITLP